MSENRQCNAVHSTQKTKGTAINATSGVLDISAYEYFVERDGDAFRSFFASTLKLGHLIFDSSSLEITGGSSGSDSARIRLVTKPELGAYVPASVRNKVANASEIEFHDEIEYVRGNMEHPPFVLRVNTKSPFLGRRFRLTSTMSISPMADGKRCVQTLQGEVEVHMLGFGGLVERMVRDSVQNTYRKLPGVISAWNEKRRALVAENGGDYRVLLGGRPLGIDCGVSWIEQYASSREENSSSFREYCNGNGPVLQGSMSSKELSEAIEFASRMSREYEITPARRFIHSVWIGFVDFWKFMFIVFVCSLLRLGLIRMTKRQSEPLRKHSSWSDVGHHHRRSASEPQSSLDLKEVDMVLQRAHVRRASYSSNDAHS